MKKFILGLAFLIGQSDYIVAVERHVSPSAFPGNANEQAIQEWQHIIGVAKDTIAGDEMQQAAQQVVVAVQKMVSLGAQNIARKLSFSEKVKLIDLVDALKELLDNCNDAVRANSLPEGNAKKEINKMGQKIMILGLPLLMLAQDKNFRDDNALFFESFRVQMYDSLKQMVHQVSAELQ